jgi:ribosome biogenesis GTPase A
MPIQWYPGHIAKMERKLKDLLKLVDVVVEVIDARLPISTVNPRLRSQYEHKPTVILLNKIDLANPTETKRWMNHFQRTLPQGKPSQNDEPPPGLKVVTYDATQSGSHKKALIDAVLQLGEARMKRLEAKGMKRRSIRTLIVGMPNVGKSSVINNIVAKKKTHTGHKAGVTRQPQWVRIHPQLELLDSPGIIPPTLENEAIGMRLATVSSVGDASFDDKEVAQFLLEELEARHAGLLSTHYKIPQEIPVSFLSIAEYRHFKTHGDKLDEPRAVQVFLAEFRQGKLGRLTLEPLSLLFETPDSPEEVLQETVS